MKALHALKPSYLLRIFFPSTDIRRYHFVIAQKHLFRLDVD